MSTLERLGRLTACPECSAPAEVTGAVELESTDGPVEHARVTCVRRHRFFMPTERLARPVAVEPVHRQPAR